MKKVLLLLSLFLINILCGQQKMLSGKLTGFPNGDKISFYDPEIMKTLDSAYINNGNFKLKNLLDDVPKSIFILLSNSSEDLILNDIFVAGENIEITGDKKDFKYNMVLKGSKFQKEKEMLNSLTKKYEIELDSLSDYLEANKDITELRKAKSKRAKEILTKLDEIKVQFIKQNANTYYALYTLSYYFDLFSKQELVDLYKRIDTQHQQSVYGQRLKTFIDVGKILGEGDAYHDFEAKGQDGKMHKLSEIKQQYILLDFTETYCAACIESVSELKKIAIDYKDNLQIVSFCADKPENIWKTGLNRDKPEWLSLWDGKGTKGPIPLKYGTAGFPNFVLIDQTRTIIKKLDYFVKGHVENMLKENIKL